MAAPRSTISVFVFWSQVFVYAHIMFTPLRPRLYPLYLLIASLEFGNVLYELRRTWEHLDTPSDYVMFTLNTFRLIFQIHVIETLL